MQASTEVGSAARPASSSHRCEVDAATAGAVEPSATGVTAENWLEATRASLPLFCDRVTLRGYW